MFTNIAPYMHLLMLWLLWRNSSVWRLSWWRCYESHSMMPLQKIQVRQEVAGTRSNWWDGFWYLILRYPGRSLTISKASIKYGQLYEWWSRANTASRREFVVDQVQWWCVRAIQQLAQGIYNRFLLVTDLVRAQIFTGLSHTDNLLLLLFQSNESKKRLGR